MFDRPFSSIVAQGLIPPSTCTVIISWETTNRYISAHSGIENSPKDINCDCHRSHLLFLHSSFLVLFSVLQLYVVSSFRCQFFVVTIRDYFILFVISSRCTIFLLGEGEKEVGESNS